MFSVCRKLMLAVVACCYLKIMKIPKVDGILNMPHLRSPNQQGQFEPALSPRPHSCRIMCGSIELLTYDKCVCVPSCGMKLCRLSIRSIQSTLICIHIDIY